jgi:hypothetical protein
VLAKLLILQGMPLTLHSQIRWNYCGTKITPLKARVDIRKFLYRHNTLSHVSGQKMCRYLWHATRVNSWKKWQQTRLHRLLLVKKAEQDRQPEIDELHRQPGQVTPGMIGQKPARGFPRNIVA